VIAGRGFADTDSPRAARVAIVNATFVRDLLAGGPALDVRVTTALVDGPIRIVGVVGDVTPAGESDRPALYMAIDQISIGSGYLIVRAQADPRSILPALGSRLRSAAPSLAMDRVHRVAEALEDSRACDAVQRAGGSDIRGAGAAAVDDRCLRSHRQRRVRALARTGGQACARRLAT
jgi:hypothetical protein